MDARILAAVGTTALLWASVFAGIRAEFEVHEPGPLAVLRLAAVGWADIAVSFSGPR